MKIDIDKLTEAELIDLNNRIVSRLKFLNQMRAHNKMLEFKIGDRVTFQPDGYPNITGIITKYNKKTVTVITEKGQHWNVSPGLLLNENLKKESKQADNKIIPFQKRRKGR